jgi:hypothetical protein
MRETAKLAELAEFDPTPATKTKASRGWGTHYLGSEAKAL